MKLKRNIPSLVKASIYTACFILLLIWTMLAIKKYNSQPLATYVSFTNGDDNLKIEFPQISLCPFDHKFLKNISDQIRNNPEFDLDEYEHAITKHLSSFVLEVRDAENNDLTDLLSPINLPRYGPCVGFDGSKLDIRVDEGNDLASFYIWIIINDTAIMSEFEGVAFLHSKYDTADAMNTNPTISIRRGKHMTHFIKKKNVTYESTNLASCGEYGVKTCRNVLNSAFTAEKYKCKVSTLNFGPHLEKHIPGYDDLPACSSNITREVLLQICSRCIKECDKAKACSSIIYGVKNEPIEMIWPENSTFLEFTFSTFQVEHYNTYVSYDFQSLVAEVGGLMGMTLGLAFSSLGDLMANLAKKYI